MPPIFVSYSDSDLDAGKSAVSALQKAGLNASGYSWSGVGTYKNAIQSQLEAASCLVMLWSHAASQSGEMHREVQRAIQAWSHARLVLVTLDDAERPVGLRDLQSLAIAPLAQAFEWTGLINQVNSLMTHANAELPMAPAEHAQTAHGGRALLIATVLVSALGSIGYAMYRHFWVEPHVRDLGPARAEYTHVFVFLALGMVLGLGTAWAWLKWRRDRSQSTSGAADDTAQLTHVSSVGPGVFISYSRLDTRTVEHLVKRIENAGHEVWIDREAGGAQRYAASIVRAIKGAHIIALMSSRNAFASDHVMREVYVAGDYKKPFIVFQLDQAEFPDEVLYFISGFPRVSVGALDQEQLQTEISKLLISGEIGTLLSSSARPTA